MKVEMVKQKDSLSDLLDAAADKAPRGVWLVIYPASGSVHRVPGRFFTFDLGGESGVAPFIMLDDTSKVMTFDPRVLIVNDRTLVSIWHPRKHLHHSHKMAMQWYSDNPDVFNTDTEAGVHFVAKL